MAKGGQLGRGDTVRSSLSGMERVRLFGSVDKKLGGRERGEMMPPLQAWALDSESLRIWFGSGRRHIAQTQ